MSERLLFVEPNPCGSEMIPTEDLSILVELKTISRGRSVIIAGSNDPIQNSQSNITDKVSFIDGTKVGKGKKHLTTNYTQLRGLGVKDDDDLESLGIESIAITFDTAYTPNIKIKFIDIRGKAVLEEGANSKYAMFFELPYPIFELTVKGFYGKAVTYCLHLTKWNASFNSSTGNFEIDTDFIGYTYAMLTDCLMGLMRAAVCTPRGKLIFDRYREEVTNQNDPNSLKYPGLKNIDEFLDYVSKVSGDLDKLKNRSENVKQLNALNKITDELKTINTNINNLIKDAEDGSELEGTVLNNFTLVNTKFDNGSTTVPGYKVKIEEYKTKTKNALTKVNGINENIEIVALKIKPENLNSPNEKSVIDIKISPLNLITPPNVNRKDTIALAINKADNTILLESTSVTSAENIASFVKDAASGATLYNFTNTRKEIDRVEEAVKARRKKLEDNLTAELKAATSQGNYQFTIGNVVDMLSIHAQVLLECIQQVSFEASNNPRRDEILRGALNTSSNKDGVPVYDTDKIFPWPEYKKPKLGSDKENAGNYETWIGSELSGVQFENVPEIKFTEKLLECLMKVAKKDALREIKEQGIDTANFYPITPLDAKIDYERDNSTSSSSLITNNPYFHALKGPNTSAVPNEALRLLLMRGFLGLGIGNRLLGDSHIITMGELEAENLFNVLLTEFERNKIRTFGASIAGLNVNKVITFGKNGSIDIVNWTDGAVPILRETSSSYEYIYSTKTFTSQGRAKVYIPVSGGFDCKGFYKYPTLTSTAPSGKLSRTETLALSKELLFIGNTVGHPTNSRTYKDDGAVYVKIIDKNLYYDTTPAVLFGDSLETYYTAVPPDDLRSFIKQSILKQLTYNNTGTLGNNINYYNGNYKTLEINKIKYDSIPNIDKEFYRKGTSDDIGSVVAAYWNQVSYDGFNWGGAYKKSAIGTYLSHRYSDTYEDSYWNMTSPQTEDNKDLDDGEFFCEHGWNSKYYYNREAKRKSKGLQRNLILDNPVELLVPHIEFGNTSLDEDQYGGFSLFGSKLYYQQVKTIQDPLDATKTIEVANDEARAFLFLHSFGWTGCIGDITEVVDYTLGDGKPVSLFDRFNFKKTTFSAEDETTTLKGLFGNNASFIKAPKLWCAFIGGLLVRYNHFHNSPATDQWIIFPKDTLQYQDAASIIPNDSQYLFHSGIRKGTAGISFMMDSGQVFRDDDDKYYAPIDKGITGLPDQVKKEFIKVFEDFVKGDFVKIQENYELFDNLADMKTAWNNLIPKRKLRKIGFGSDYAEIRLISKKWGGNKQSNVTTSSTPDLNTYWVLKYKDITGEFPNKTKKIKNCYNITPMENLRSGAVNAAVTKGETIPTPNTYQFNMTYKPGEGNDELVRMIQEEVVIMNASPRSFRGTDQAVTPNPDPYRTISANGDYFNLFIDSFLRKFRGKFESWKKNNDNENDNIQQQIFNTVDDDLIKLNIYRTLASLNNKWIGEKSFEGCSDINSITKSFKFLDSGFFDISDKFFINPKLIAKKIRSNYNQSFFDVVNKLLTDNSFNFIPLPTFIDFNNEKELEDAFKPYSWKESIEQRTKIVNGKKEKVYNGPSFVCVYTGQISTNLDLGDKSTHKDDGIVILSDCEGKHESATEPINFQPGPNDDVKSIKIPYFLVSYGKENQSFFKDIKLDQREFTETAESLQIIEDLSQNGNKRKATFKGQNLFNIYQTRAYSAEVEMMGNAMIQPMMYFQLNNIPMFRGAYMIMSTTHNITAHNMTTKFKGVRIKKTKTELIKESDLFMNLLGDYSSAGEATKITDTNINSSNTTSSGSNTGTPGTSGTPGSGRSGGAGSGSGANSGSGASTISGGAAAAQRIVSPSDMADLDWMDPVDNGPITSAMGHRTGNSQVSSNHKGIDIGCVHGSTLSMVGDGEIEIIRLRYTYDSVEKKWGGFGLHIITKHVTSSGKIYRALYGHLSNINPSILDLTTLTLAQKNQLIGGGIKPSVTTKLKGAVLGKTGGNKGATAAEQAFVESLDPINKGEILGKPFEGSGTGPHLHFEVRAMDSGVAGGFWTPPSADRLKDPTVLLPIGYNDPHYVV